MYKLNENDDFKYITFPVLEQFNDLFHCFTTRSGGVSQGPFATLNLGLNIGDNRESVIKNYHILSDELSLDLDNIVSTVQTHTNNIKYVSELDKCKIFEKPQYSDIDGLITDKKNVALMTFHADCTPLFFYDSNKRIVGMAHAGWRGTLKNIAGIMVQKFINDFNSDPADIFAAVGPSLGQCCFEVDRDVADLFLSSNNIYEKFMHKSGNKYHFDLWNINKYLMKKEGIQENNIQISGLCTKCNNHLFFSHRGQRGKRGLMAGFIMMK